MKAVSRKLAGKKPIRVAELFAGVGGFRAGFERASRDGFETVWFNQWEPGESDKAQHAWKVYCNAFGEDMLSARICQTNIDISKVDLDVIEEHDLLVGGFPCQDYSVAKPLSQAAGIQGKKGVLWWSIHRILEGLGEKKPRYLLLENVDRLLKSPASQRGRDFAIILATLADLGYAVEWRVINAGDYGMPQRRRRVYFFGFLEGTKPHSHLSVHAEAEKAVDYLLEHGIMASAFPATADGKLTDLYIEGEPHEITRDFDFGEKSPFATAGFMKNRQVYTLKIAPIREEETTLGAILHEPGDVEDEYLKTFEVNRAALDGWKAAKGAKSEPRKDKKTGFEYEYTEGAMLFPDPTDRPSRTIVTGEGGSSASRFKHVVKDKRGKLRRLTPVELERLNMFADDHTKLEGVSDVKRAFFMGNALVVGIVERLGKELLKRHG